MSLLPLLLALALALVHMLAGSIRFLGKIPRSRWLSLAGGAAVAYVFVHLLPDLNHWQNRFQEHAEHPLLDRLDNHLYLVALIGLTFWYGLEHAVRPHSQPVPDPAKLEQARTLAGRSPREAEWPSGVFWVHVGTFAMYNALIGYLLASERRDLRELLLFFTAMALHFLVNDFALRRHHKALYRQRGRWVLSLAVIGGAVAGMLWPFPPQFIGLLFAFLAGGIVLNVLKEELPEDRESQFWAFVVGAAVYSAVLLI
jgi:zinc transporter ZupT